MRSILIISLGLSFVVATAHAQTTPPQKITIAEAPGDEFPFRISFGQSLAQIGDVDGDGVVDLAVGGNDQSPLDVPTEGSFGRIVILLMRSDGTVKRQIQIPRLEAFDLAGFGETVTGLGDVDGNGVVDIAVGASRDATIDFEVGSVFVLFLESDGSVLGHRKIVPEDVATSSMQRQKFGRSVVGPGDIDGDGVPDLFVGMSGTATLFTILLNTDGSVKSSTEISVAAGTFPGRIGAATMGHTLGSAGDFDLDGVPDMLVGVPNNREGPPVFLLLLNSSGGVKRHVDLWVNDLQPQSASLGLDDLGDLDGDGVNDFAVGNGTHDTFNRGIAWILFMRADGSIKGTVTMDPTDASHGLSIGSNDRFGKSIAGLGDLNGDGVLDLAVGAPGDDDEGSDQGAIWVVFSLPNLASEIDLVNLNDLTAEAPALGEDVQIQAEIFGLADVASAEINFRRGGDPSFFSAPMTVEDNTLYTFPIPAFAVNERGIEYFITTTNSSGAETRAPSAGVISVPVSVTKGLTATIPGGQAREDYRLVSIPLTLESKDASSVFEDDLGIYNTSSWRMYAMESGSRVTEFSVREPEIESGQAYWMLAGESNRAYNSGAGLSVPTDTLYPIRLNNGWNLVANPYSFLIPRTNLTTSGNQPVDLWSFSGSWRSGADTLLPFTGYAFFSEHTDTLWVDPDLTPANVAANAANNTKHQTSNTKLWRISEGRSSLEALFGTNALGQTVPLRNDLAVDVYPNPFVSSTTIGYELRSEERVSIRIYDMLGREVIRLLDGPQQAGRHEVVWGVSSETISSGVFVVQIQAGDVVWSRTISRAR